MVERVLLPSNVVPSKYAIDVTPDLERFVFDGTVAIEVDVSAETTTVVPISHITS